MSVVRVHVIVRMEAGFSLRRVGGNAVTSCAGLARGGGRNGRRMRGVRRHVSHSRSRRALPCAESTPRT
eukprot:2231794-Pleurochrysis_carterae.AAC.1